MSRLLTMLYILFKMVRRYQTFLLLWNLDQVDEILQTRFSFFSFTFFVCLQHCSSFSSSAPLLLPQLPRFPTHLQHSCFTYLHITHYMSMLPTSAQNLHVKVLNDKEEDEQNIYSTILFPSFARWFYSTRMFIL